MRLDTGPVCIVDQTAPKTTPRPTPRDASRMRDVRTQLAPAMAFGGRGGGRGTLRSKRWRRVSVFSCACVALQRPQHFGALVCARGVGAADEQQMQALALGAFFAAARRADARFSTGGRLHGLFEAYERRGQAPPMLLIANFAPQPANRETRFLPGKEQQKPELRVFLGRRLTGERGKRRLRRFPRPSTSIQSGRGGL